ncbi:ABC transporter ATP-binding protein [Humidisolicoccus flavus]|uniref:ABC transporter ATP-binding protein n=1 Tax=Humidisolicoccus flavus TaxID=3111414 RepID=UPI003247D6B2
MTAQSGAASRGSGLEAHELTVSLGGTEIVHAASLQAIAGKVTALIGPNGSGKSTLLRAIAGLVPAQGSISLDGAPLTGLRRTERARRIAFVEQQSHTELDLFAREVVALGRTPHQGMFGGASREDEAMIARSLERTGAEAFADRKFQTLSGGERQRVLLAAALAQDPRVLILDEPTNHLDIAAQLDTMTLLASLARDGVAVIAALHDLSLAGGADHLVILRDGAVAASGPPATVLTASTIGSVYGVSALVVNNPLTGTPTVLTAPADMGPPLEEQGGAAAPKDEFAPPAAPSEARTAARADECTGERTDTRAGTLEP